MGGRRIAELTEQGKEILVGKGEPWDGDGQE